MNLFKSLIAALEKIRKAAGPLGGLNSSIHAAGGVGGSITMVMAFARSLCFLCVGLVVPMF